ncbi:MAG: ABC transporter permease, partial [Chloroflexota bacterium]
SLSSGSDAVPRTETVLDNGFRIVTYEFTFNYPFTQAPAEIQLYLDAAYQQKRPFISVTWYTPDGRQMDLKSASPISPEPYNFTDSIPFKRLVWSNPMLQKWFIMDTNNPTPVHYLLFTDPNKDKAVIVNGTYRMRVSGMFFEKTGDLKADLVLMGQVYGPAGTDYLRRNLIVPLLWGLPFALLFGLLGAMVTTILSMIVAASGVWFGGWMDNLTQRLTEANMIMPVLAISVLAHALLGISLWVILAVVVLLNIFGSPTKTFRSAFLQLKDAPYIEAARAYGASSSRIILQYMLPRIIPVLVPQLVTLIPSYVFLEATLGMFNIKSEYPTWGTVIYRALTKGALWGAPYWVMEPLGMLLLTGLAFAMLGYALERILNPRLREQ